MMIAARRRMLTGMLLLCIAACTSARLNPAAAIPEVAPERELVVLVHGMGRSWVSMVPLSWTLERAGFEVMNWGYSSTCCTIEELGDRLEHDLQEHPSWGAGPVHFVGHSLGNIIIRSALGDEAVAESAGRIVMLAPPNQGSKTADRLTGAFGWLLMPIAELRTDSVRIAVPHDLPEHVSVHVIAGRFDRKVSVEETRLDGIESHQVLPATHAFLMFRADVHRLIVQHLRERS